MGSVKRFGVITICLAIATVTFVVMDIKNLFTKENKNEQ